MDGSSTWCDVARILLAEHACCTGQQTHEKRDRCLLKCQGVDHACINPALLCIGNAAFHILASLADATKVTSRS